MKQSSKKKRIAVIGLKGLPAFGGAATVGESIISLLKNDFEFTVLSVSTHTKLKSGKINGINQIVFNTHLKKGSVNTLIYYYKCLFYVLFNKYDLIFLHQNVSGFITPFLRTRYKVIVTFHGTTEIEDPKFSSLQNRLFRLSEKWNMKYANKIISVSKPHKEYFEKKYGKEVEYIPNGIFVRNIEKKAKTETYILFAAGRIYQLKGLHILLDALKKLNLDIKIKIAGDFNQVRVYKESVFKKMEGLNIEMLGLITDKEELMEIVNEATLFIFPSLFEAMSMMLLEVVSMKTPIIASDIPANSIIFSENEMLFFKNNEVSDLAEKIQFAISNPIKMNELANRAYEKLVNNYTWEIIAEKYKSIFNEFLN